MGVVGLAGLTYGLALSRHETAAGVLKAGAADGGDRARASLARTATLMRDSKVAAIAGGAAAFSLFAYSANRFFLDPKGSARHDLLTVAAADTTAGALGLGIVGGYHLLPRMTVTEKLSGDATQLEQRHLERVKGAKYLLGAAAAIGAAFAMVSVAGPAPDLYATGKASNN
jgi:hypothetical protein